MKMKFGRCAFLYFASAFNLCASAGSVESAKTFINGLVQLSTLSRDTKGVVTAESNKKVKELSEGINFNELSRLSLGPTRWKGYSAADRSKFTNTLQELLEVVAYPKANKISASAQNLNYEPSKVRKNGVRVWGNIEISKKGELVSESIEIELIYDNDQKQIVDAVLAGELLSSNLKRQFDSALKKKTFKDIISQMKKRVAESKNNGKK